MSRPLATVLVVCCVLVAGCSGLGGSDADSTPDETPASTSTPAPDSSSGDGEPTDGTAGNDSTDDGSGDDSTDDGQNADEMPPVENQTFTDGQTLNVTALYKAQFDYFNASDGYTVESTISSGEPSNGFVERYDERRLDLVENRGYGITEFVRENGSRVHNGGYFFNESVLVRLQGSPETGTVQNQSFPSNFFVRAVASYADATAINSITPVELQYEDTITSDGQTVYRFVGDSFAADASAGAIRSTYGQNASVRDATVLVTPEGHVTHAEVQFSSGVDDSYRRGTATYDVTVGQPEFQTPDWVADAQ